jgi:hypothetical protein
MDWIYLAQARDRWQALVSAVMNLRVPLSVGNFSTTPLHAVGLFVT